MNFDMHYLLHIFIYDILVGGRRRVRRETNGGRRNEERGYSGGRTNKERGLIIPSQVYVAFLRENSSLISIMLTLVKISLINLYEIGLLKIIIIANK